MCSNVMMVVVMVVVMVEMMKPSQTLQPPFALTIHFACSHSQKAKTSDTSFHP